MTESELASAISSIAAHESWSKTPDRAPARQAMLEKFERDVDPDGVMSPTDRVKAAENARKAYFRRLALKSAKVRKQRRESGAA